jgi:hypothetical protein
MIFSFDSIITAVGMAQHVEIMIRNAADRFDEQGRLGDEPTRQLIRALLVKLVQMTRNTAANSNSEQ